MDVSLTPELETFVQSEVSSGLYQTASDVVRAGLLRLKEDQQRRLPSIPETRDEFEAQLVRSIEALESGQGCDGQAVLRRLRQRIEQAKASG